MKSTKRLIFFLILLSLFGCSKYTGKEILFNNLKTMEHSLNQEDWEQLKSQVNELNTLYEENKWKLQLLGDEGEYEGLNESINRLFAAINTEDLTQAKVELATIRSILEEIYSL